MILLDTHAWVWFAGESDRLSRKAAARIRNASRIGVCTISIWEVAMLYERGQVKFDRDLEQWLTQASSLPDLELCAISPAIGRHIYELGQDFHGDPADRIVAATALALGAELVTKDERMHAFKPLRCVW